MIDSRAVLEAYADEHEGTERLTHIHRADATPRARSTRRGRCWSRTRHAWPTPTTTALAGGGSDA